VFPGVPEIMEMQSCETHVGERLAPVRLTPEVATPQEPAAGAEDDAGSVTMSVSRPGRTLHLLDFRLRRTLQCSA
jgi:hypothetical protein